MDPLKRIAKEDGRLHVAGTPEGFDALVVADAARARGGITCFVATDHGRATSFLDAVGFFAPDLEVLRFRAWRRGFREADLILGPFADTHVGRFTPAQLDEFSTLLDQPDHDLYGWIVGQSPAPSAFDGEVLALIRDFRFDARNARPDPGA